MSTLLHVLLIASFVYFFVLRMSFGRKAKQAQKNVEEKEGTLNLIVRAFLGIGYMLMMLVYLIYPGWFVISSIGLPLWLRWTGVALLALSLAGLTWVQWALDVQFNTTLHVQEDHKLIQHGPYHWVRHPMYTVLIALGLGWGLVSANLVIGFPVSVAVVGIILNRIRREEATLVEIFGDQYRAYMKRTGRFLPKFH